MKARKIDSFEVAGPKEQDVSRAWRRIVVGCVLCMLSLSISSYREDVVTPAVADQTTFALSFKTGEPAAEAPHGTIGIQVDILNDVLGLALIFLGVSVVRKLARTDLNRMGFGFVRGAIVLLAVDAAINHLIFDRPAGLVFFHEMCEYLRPLAVLAFFMGMWQLSVERRCHAPHRWWRRATWAQLLIWGLPALAMHAAAETPGLWPANLQETSIEIEGIPSPELWLAFAGLFVLMALPWLFALRATVATRRALPEYCASAPMAWSI